MMGGIGGLFFAGCYLQIRLLHNQSNYSMRLGKKTVYSPRAGSVRQTMTCLLASHQN